MALRGFWGFDGSSTQIQYPEWGVYATGVGRDGVANHANYLNGNSNVPLIIPGAAASGIIVGFALYKGAWPALTNRYIMQFLSGAVQQGELYWNTTNTNELTFRVGSTDMVTTVGLNWFNNVDHYIEIKYIPHGTAGTLVVHVDGVEVLNYTGQTAVVGTTTINQLGLSCGTGAAAWIDDMYLLDLTDGTATDGRPNNDFLGDCKVVHAYPSADGSTVAWTPSTGTNHAALVDENPVNTTDYNSAVGASNLKDLYDIPDLPGAANTVYGVRVIAYAAKTDSGAATIKAMIRDNSTDSAISGSLAIGTTFGAVFSDFIKLRPSAGGVFTVANVNAMQIGVQAS